MLDSDDIIFLNILMFIRSGLRENISQEAAGCSNCISVLDFPSQVYVLRRETCGLNTNKIIPYCCAASG